MGAYHNGTKMITSKFITNGNYWYKTMILLKRQRWLYWNYTNCRQFM